MLDEFSISIYSELKLRMSLYIFDFLFHVNAIPFNLFHYFRNILYIMRIKKYFYQTFRFFFEELFYKILFDKISNLFKLIFYKINIGIFFINFFIFCRYFSIIFYKIVILKIISIFYYFLLFVSKYQNIYYKIPYIDR